MTMRNFSTSSQIRVSKRFYAINTTGHYYRQGTDIMGFTKFKGHYCLKCQTHRPEALGAMPRCEQCGTDLRYAEVSHTPAQFAGYFLLGLLLVCVLGVIVMTLIMAVIPIVILAVFSTIFGVLAIICILLNKGMMKGKITKAVS